MFFSKFHQIISRRFLLASIAAFTVGTSLHAEESIEVNSVLRAEGAGNPIDRRQLLSKDSNQHSQWQSGRILVEGQWVDMESLQSQKLSPQMEAYKRERGDVKLDTQGHRRMARWCKAQGLPDMERAHWKALVTLAVDDEEARKALGHKRFGDDWLSSEESKQAATNQQKEIDQLKQWMPRLQKIISKMQSPKAQIKIEGIKELEQINDKGSIAALKNSVYQVEPTTALPLVSKIKSIRCTEACLALCELAATEPNSVVGRSALEGLKEYDEHFYVPDLLQMLELPTRLVQEMKFTENSSFVVRRAYVRETMTQKEQTEILKLISGTYDERLGLSVTGLIRSPQIQRFLVGKPMYFYWTEYYPASSEALAKLANIERKVADIEMQHLNQLKAQQQQNIKIVLASVSGLSPNESAEAYWNWWPNFNENYSTFDKPTSYQYGVDDSNFVPVPRYFVDVASCLIAGTSIQCAEGLRPIEEIKVGDIVASLNVESGETALRPVTYISDRTADTTFLFTTSSGETIRATGGHYWWVIGKGWLRSRELAEGQFMRTGNASVEITKIEKLDDPIKVYNLIIDDSHTYFVGKDRLLSWDLSALQPTLQTAPGQTDLQYASAK